MRLLSYFVFVGSLLIGSAAAAQDWEFLGERVVNFRAEQDVIPVGVRDGRFARIQLRVLENAVNILDLQVNFANGSSADIPVRAVIPAGGQTRAIDLPGERRIIRDVRIIYRSAGQLRDGRAMIRLFGLRDAPQPPHHPPPTSTGNDVAAINRR